MVRAVPIDTLQRDPGFARHADVERGAFDLAAADSVVIGAELASRLGVRVGDQLAVVTLANTDLTRGPRALQPNQVWLDVTGVFRSGYYQYDIGWAFIGPATAARFAGRAPAPDTLVRETVLLAHR